MPLNVATAELIGTFLETLCYGLYLSIFFEGLAVFYARYREGRNIWCLLAATFIMFSLITTHLGLDISRVIDAFTRHMDIPNEANIYYALLSTTSRLAKITTYVVLTLVSDAVFVYRVYVIWGCNYAVASVPFLLWVVDIGLSAWALHILTGIKPGDNPLVHETTMRFRNFYILTLTLNVLCTSMISWKIWSVHRKVKRHAVAGVRVYGIMKIIIESAAVYSGLLTGLIVTTVIDSTALWIIIDSICPMIGMIFSGMLVRASKEYHNNSFMSNDMSLPSALDDTEPVSEGCHTSTCSSSRTLSVIQEKCTRLASGKTCRMNTGSGVDTKEDEMETGRCAMELPVPTLASYPDRLS